MHVTFVSLTVFLRKVWDGCKIWMALGLNGKEPNIANFWSRIWLLMLSSSRLIFVSSPRWLNWLSLRRIVRRFLIIVFSFIKVFFIVWIENNKNFWLAYALFQSEVIWISTSALISMNKPSWLLVFLILGLWGQLRHQKLLISRISHRDFALIWKVTVRLFLH